MENRNQKNILDSVGLNHLTEFRAQSYELFSNPHHLRGKIITIIAVIIL
jgi:hypothetical protein